jgi:hypothetical protein
MSHHQQIWEQTQPMEVKEAPGVPPPSPHFKKKAFWGLYHTKKWFLSDLRKRPRCPVWAGDTELNPSTLSLSNFISRAMAKLGPFSWQPALSRTGDGEIRDEEIGRAPQAQGPPHVPSVLGWDAQGRVHHHPTVLLPAACRGEAG